MEKKYINLDNVTTIEEKGDGLGYVVYFVGQTQSRSISAADMVDIRSELEKIKTLQDIDKIFIQNTPEVE